MPNICLIGKIPDNKHFGDYIQSKPFIISLVITEYSIYNIKLLGTDLFPFKFPAPTVLSGNRYTISNENKFILSKLLPCVRQFCDQNKAFLHVLSHLISGKLCAF